MGIRLNGEVYSSLQDIKQKVDSGLGDFLEEWYDEKTYVVGHTSGSTGAPKEIHLNKADMRASARVTNDFFDIHAGSVLLLCLPVSYIAGKMMVVRALEAGAELWVVRVSSHPMREWRDRMVAEFQANGVKKIDLAAMVPLQVEETIKSETERGDLSYVRQLLIGGASVSPELERQLQYIPTYCYATYGMTETVSHVGLRRLNRDSCYFAVGDVHFLQDERGCLVIHAPHLQTGKFVTNDLVSLIDSRHFEWLGRYDHVINSGGIKFCPEVIENKITSFISSRYFITSKPDERLGQRIVLVVEGICWEQTRLDGLEENLHLVLSPYEMPKEILFLAHFHETESGKVIRKIS